MIRTMGFLGALSIADVLKSVLLKLLAVVALLHARTITADYDLGTDLTFIRLKMPGWTCIHMIATSAIKP
jgi:hypothetical protein